MWEDIWNWQLHNPNFCCIQVLGVLYFLVRSVRTQNSCVLSEFLRRLSLVQTFVISFRAISNNRSWAVQRGRSRRPHVTPTISHALLPNVLTAYSDQDKNSQAVLSNLVKWMLESRYLSYHIAYQIGCHFNYPFMAVMSFRWPPFPSPCFLALPGIVYEPWRCFLDP